MFQIQDVPEGMPLFTGIKKEEQTSLLGCLSAKELSFAKGDMIFLAGNPAKWVGAMLAGEAQVIKEDFWGNRVIMTGLGVGDLFGEIFACAGLATLPVSVMAVTDVRVLLMDYKRIVTTCPSSCVFHSRLISNMLKVVAEKSLLLNRKVDVLSAHGTREKLLTFLAAQAEQQHSRRFAIAFNRQELADYLAVDRSALSREMSRMQKDGVIQYEKNWFELLR